MASGQWNYTSKNTRQDRRRTGADDGQITGHTAAKSGKVQHRLQTRLNTFICND